MRLGFLPFATVFENYLTSGVGLNPSQRFVNKFLMFSGLKTNMLEIEPWTGIWHGKDGGSFRIDGRS